MHLHLQILRCLWKRDNQR